MKKVLIFLLLITAAFAQTFEMNGYKVERETVKSAQHKDDLSKLSYSVFNSNGDLQTSFKVDWSYDLPFPQPGVFENGSIILVSSFDAAVKFYNRFGQFENEIRLLKDAEPEYERSIHFDLKNDKMIFAISEPKMERAVVKIIERSGSTLNEFSSKYKNISGIKFSEDAQLIALSSHGWNNSGPVFESAILDENLQTIFSIDQPFETANFVDGGKYFYGFSNRNFFLIDLIDFSVKIDSRLKEDQILLEAGLFEDQIILVASSQPKLNNGRWIFSEATVIKYNRMGELLVENTLKTNEFVECDIQIQNSEPVLLLDSRVFSLN